MNNLSHKSNDTIDLVQSVTPSTRISARELHKYVVGLVGIFMLFVITYPIAIHRVDRQSKVAKAESLRNTITAGSKSILSRSSR